MFFCNKGIRNISLTSICIFFNICTPEFACTIFIGIGIVNNLFYKYRFAFHYTDRITKRCIRILIFSYRLK
uniref:Uncharacterized protein n=1 Tax=Pararge aegeria TaxID=116150 RepID=S4P1H2_9NEOP